MVCCPTPLEAKLFAAVLKMIKVVFCSHMMLELEFGETLGRIPLFIGNTSTLQVAGNRTYLQLPHKTCGLRFFFIPELIRKGKITLHHVSTE